MLCKNKDKMRFYYLSSLQKLEIGIATFMFCLLIGFLRPLLLNLPFNSQHIVALTLLFFCWYGMTILMANAYTYQQDYQKIVNI